MKFVTHVLSGLVPVEVPFEVVPSSTFEVVGCSPAHSRETRVRVRAALLSHGVPEGALCARVVLPDGARAVSDLHVALALLALAGVVPEESLHRTLVVGDLTLTGAVAATRGTLPLLDGVQDVRRAIVPYAGREEASRTSSGADVYAVQTLAGAVDVLRSGVKRFLVAKQPLDPLETREDMSDLGDLGGVARALEVAVAGGHGLLLVGPPGAGKTSVARRVRSLLPAHDEATLREVAHLRSVAAIESREVPFRAPHHTMSSAGLVGGGEPYRPGEVSLAHGGVLFLDEQPEFRLAVLQSLRDPLRSGEAVVVRERVRRAFPARVQLVAAAGPCYCGFRGVSSRACSCSPESVARYAARLSECPIAPSLSVKVRVPCVDPRAQTSRSGESSEVVRARVTQARRRQVERQGKLNAQLMTDEMEAVAQTIADLAGTVQVDPVHCEEARALTAWPV